MALSGLHLISAQGGVGTNRLDSLRHHAGPAPAVEGGQAENNLLGYKEPAVDLIVSTYFKNFNPFDFAGCYRGSASYFMLMGGPVPAGDKILIQSTRYMYCID